MFKSTDKNTMLSPASLNRKSFTMWLRCLPRAANFTCLRFHISLACAPHQQNHLPRSFRNQNHLYSCVLGLLCSKKVQKNSFTPPLHCITSVPTQQLRNPMALLCPRASKTPQLTPMSLSSWNILKALRICFLVLRPASLFSLYLPPRSFVSRT